MDDIMGLPNINIAFVQAASASVTSGTRGIVALIVRDDTNTTFSTVTYTLASAIDSTKFTAANAQFITDCFVGTPTSVTVIRIGASGVIADALTIAATLDFDWLGVAETIVGDSDAVATWIKSQEALKKTYKAIVYNPTTAPDCKHVVNFVNTSVTFLDTTRGTSGVCTGETYISTLLGIFAGISLSKSATYYICTNLSAVTEVADNDTAIDKGELVLINDSGDVRIGAGVNSLVTLDTNDTSDMQQICIVEAMDLMLDDIRTTFKDSFIGNYKNKYANQIILISAINAYFNTLADEDVLDADYTNVCSVDVDAQRAAWLAAGKTEASSWTDAQVRNNTFKNQVFLAANVKILGGVENLQLSITMN
jgi:hypothetical protein